MDNNPTSPLEEEPSYKGHPQPPVDERLGQAKIFLADEDMNRCLGFTEKLQQIEEYLQHVEKENLVCKAELFNDVKTMAKIQRDWVQRMDAGPVDPSCSNPPALPNFSTRLVDAGTASKIAAEKERTGLVTQMREDHAPFTVTRSADQTVFLNQLRADASVCPDDVDESENLLFVENEAYKWALSQPVLIPQWMHRDKGLPNRGLKLGEEPQPWYRQRALKVDSYRARRTGAQLRDDSDRQRPTVAPSGDGSNAPGPAGTPLRNQLPAHLLMLEILINRSLQEDWYGEPGGYAPDQWRGIQDSMYLVEPDTLQVEHRRLRNLEAKHALMEEMELATPGDTQHVIDERLDFERHFCDWVELFRDLSIQVKTSGDGVNGVDPSSDEFYVEAGVIETVVQQYRKWQDTQRQSDEDAANQGTSLDESDTPADFSMRELYDILREFVTSVKDISRQDKLMLDRIPASLQSVRVELTSQLILVQSHSPPSDVEGRALKQLQRTFINEWLEWLNGLPLTAKLPSIARSSRATDFTGMAERRGVQRAAIELALNLLATNQEQHRPKDKFRKLRSPPGYQPPRGEVPLSLPLKPWQRPVEVDPWKYTKIMREHRQSEDSDYGRSRDLIHVDFPANLPAPSNRVGPWTVASDDETFDVIKNRQNYLVHLQSSLLQAATRAPRPIIHTINNLIDEVCRMTIAAGGSANLSGKGHHVVDDEPLTQADLEILSRLTDASWYEGVLDYPTVIPGVPSTSPFTSAQRLVQFEKEVISVLGDVPFWSAPLNQALDHPFDQPIYDPHIQSMAEDGSPLGWFVAPDSGTPDTQLTLLQHINARHGQGHAAWNIAEATVYLHAMSVAHKIYFGHSRGRALVARIPPNAHPETKFFVNRAEVGRSSRVTQNVEINAWEVQYDSAGTRGIPIIQPNKYDFLQDVARRVGRDIGEKSIELTQTHDNVDKLTWRMTSLGRVNSKKDEVAANREDNSIMEMARNIVRVAPDLAQEAGVDFSDPTQVSQHEAGMIVQMQALEEANNCWEPRFPEDEPVWDWAAPRVNDRIRLSNGREVNGVQPQFFDMCRWPPACQSAEPQARVKRSPPVMQEKPQPEAPPPAMTREEIVAAKKKKLREEGRHTGRGQRPSFTFGETPLQQSYQSMMMEKHLADVDQFYPKPDPPGFVSRALGSLKRKFWGDSGDHMGHYDPPSDDDDPNDRYRLPKIPKGWRPDSVSKAEKRYDVAERLMREDGFPNTEALYFSAAEVAGRQYRRAQDEIARGKQMAREAIERHCGMEWKYIKDEQRRMARVALDIDPSTDMFRPKPKAVVPRLDLGMVGPPRMTRPILSPTRPETPRAEGRDLGGGESSGGEDSLDGEGVMSSSRASRGGTRGRGGIGRGGSNMGRQPSTRAEMSGGLGDDMSPTGSSRNRPTEAAPDSEATGENTGSMRYPQLPIDSSSEVSGSVVTGARAGTASVVYPETPPPSVPARNTRSRSTKKRSVADEGEASAGSPMKKKSKKRHPPQIEEEEEEDEKQIGDDGRRFTDI